MTIVCVEQSIVSAFTNSKSPEEVASTDAQSKDKMDNSSDTPATSINPAVGSIAGHSFHDKTTVSPKDTAFFPKDTAIGEDASSKRGSGGSFAELSEGPVAPFPSDHETSAGIAEITGREAGGHTNRTKDAAGENTIQSFGAAVTLDSTTPASTKAPIGPETQTPKEDARQEVPIHHHNNRGKWKAARQHWNKPHAKTTVGKKRSSGTGGKKIHPVKGAGDAADEDLGEGGAVEDDDRHGEVHPVPLPAHVVTEDYCTFWVSTSP